MQEPETYAGIGVVVGVAITKILSFLIKNNLSESTLIRKELRQEVTLLRDEIKQLHNELDEWKDRFYKLNFENTKLKAEMLILKQKVNTIKDREEQDS
jgi:predicted RNase H-like nuclease (RuvC/YqgF family)